LATLFKPYQGYYLYNSQNLPVLKIPYTLLFRAPTVNKAPQPDWRISASLEVGNFKDSCAALGVSAQDTLPLSQLKPRLTGSVPIVYFSKPELSGPLNVFAADIRAMKSETETWLMTVQTIPRQVSALVFSGLDKIPNDLHVYLSDKERGLYQDLQQDSVYHFISSQVLNKFNVTVSTKNASGLNIDTASPRSYVLGQCFPNPFNSTTTVYYEVPQYSWVRLKIYNLRGQQIKLLYEGNLYPGRYRTLWDATNEFDNRIASGIYIIRMESNGFSAVVKAVYTK
jgi:hypothetical protein